MNTAGLEPYSPCKFETDHETPIFLYQWCQQCGRRRVVILDRDTTETFDRSWLNGARENPSNSEGSG